MGTPNYMSPEQTIDAASVNDRADSWSVGVMLFELASGRTPYVASSSQEIFTLTISQPAPPLLSVAPKAPPRLAALVDRCLSREAASRPDVRTIAQELDAIFPAVVATATPPKAARSSSLLWIGCVAAAAATVLGGGGLGAYLVVRARDEARAEARRAAEESLARSQRLAAGQLSVPGAGVVPPVVTSPSRPTPADAVRMLGPSRVPLPLDAPIRPTPNGPLVIQIVSDLQCGACPRFVPLVANRLETQFPNAIRFAMRHYPVPMNDRAMQAWEAALEVRAQGGDAAYWRFYDAILTQSQAAQSGGRNDWDLSESALATTASAVGGIDSARVIAALRDRRHVPRIEQDIDALDRFAGGERWSYGQRYGIPTFIIHGTVCWPGNQLDLFRAVEQALQGRTPQPCSYQ